MLLRFINIHLAVFNIVAIHQQQFHLVFILIAHSSAASKPHHRSQVNLAIDWRIVSKSGIYPHLHIETPGCVVKEIQGHDRYVRGHLLFVVSRP